MLVDPEDRTYFLTYPRLALTTLSDERGIHVHSQPDIPLGYLASA
jgi:hypothetical protein